MGASPGHALAITTPAGETTQLTYSNGLLTSLTDPKSQTHTFEYDGLGRLLRDTDPLNATIGLTTALVNTPVPQTGGIEPFQSATTTLTTPLGHTTTREDFVLSDGSRERNVVAPSGATTSRTESSNELWTMVAPDGTITTVQEAPDPQFGMIDGYPGTTKRKTPSGLTYSASGSHSAPPPSARSTRRSGRLRVRIWGRRAWRSQAGGGITRAWVPAGGTRRPGACRGWPGRSELPTR